MDIGANVKRFMGDRTAEQRYASFDYCFNYFQSFWEGGSTADIATPENMLLSCLSTAGDIQKALRHPDGAWPTWTLATKVMLGVFGNVPAFDSRVVAGLRKTGLAGRFDFRALRDIGGFYEDHREVIEHHRECTLDFATGQPTHRPYTRAKVIDEIFFIEGRGGVSAL